MSWSLMIRTVYISLSTGLCVVLVLLPSYFCSFSNFQAKCQVPKHQKLINASNLDYSLLYTSSSWKYIFVRVPETSGVGSSMSSEHVSVILFRASSAYIPVEDNSTDQSMYFKRVCNLPLVKHLIYVAEPKTTPLTGQ